MPRKACSEAALGAPNDAELGSARRGYAAKLSSHNKVRWRDANMGQDCTVITFTCDRSGVGQSMALSSTALMLAANGRRVLAIDWDLAKPSLAKYFAPFLSTDALENNDGLIDVVWGYASAVRRAPLSDLPKLQLGFAAVSPIECSIPDELRVSRGGAMHLLSAGREPKRSLRVRYFSWAEFFDRLDGDDLLAALWRELRRRYDHVLIDCPQLSNASKFPVLNADILIPCFTLDRESMQAGGALVRWATERLTARRLVVYPLTLRVQRAELKLLYQARETRDRLFRQLEEIALLPRDPEFCTAAEVPETPFLANRQILPPLFGIKPAEEASRRLACAITDQPDLEWRVPDEEQAAKYQSAYEVAAVRVMAPQVLPLLLPYSGHEAYAFVSYARDDRDKVMPVLQEITDLGWRLWWDEEIPGGSEWHSYLHGRIEKATYMLVFLSARSVRSKWVSEEIRLAQEFTKPFLSIRLDWSPVAEESQRILSRYQMLDGAAIDFREQLGRGMQLLQASSCAT